MGQAGIEVLFEDEYMSVEEHRDARVVVVRRKSTRAPDQQPAAMFNAALDLARPEHRDWGLVIDVRQVAGRNDPAFENALGPVRARSAETFARTVVLVRSVVGRLQADRLSRRDGIVMAVSRDETEAMEIAAGLREPKQHAG